MKKKRAKYRSIWYMASLLGQECLGFAHRKHRTHKKAYPRNSFKSNKLYCLKLKEADKQLEELELK